MNTDISLEVRLERVCEEAELDELWSFVGNKSNHRWLWHVVDHATNTVLAYVFGQRKDVVFKHPKALFAPSISVVIPRMTGTHMSSV
jgi:IS1 family transposase